MTKFLQQDGDIEIIDDFNDAPEQLSDAEEKAALLQEALSEDAGSFITCHRVVGSGNIPEEFVARFQADKYDYAQILEYLKENYGGGEYRLRLYVKGRLRKGGNKLIQIANAIPKQKDQTDTTLSIVMQQMEKMNQQMLTIMKDKQTGGNSRMEMMQEMMMMKQLFAPTERGGGRSVGGIGDILDTVEGLKALGIQVGNQPIEQEPGLSRLFDLATPLIQKAMESPTPVPVVQQAPLLSNPQPRQPTMNQMIAIGLIPLVKAAAKNSDPALYAPMVLDNVDEANIRRFFNSPTGMADLIKIQPNIANHLAWFELLGEHVKAHLGLPSKVDHLYEDEESASVNGIETATGAPADERDSQLHDDVNT